MKRSERCEWLKKRTSTVSSTLDSYIRQGKQRTLQTVVESGEVGVTSALTLEEEEAARRARTGAAKRVSIVIR
jgi:hypothetical protein